jgi:hypothetical protein
MEGPDISQEFGLAVFGGFALGVLLGIDAIDRLVLLIAVAVCAGYLAIRVMRKTLA